MPDENTRDQLAYARGLERELEAACRAAKTTRSQLVGVIEKKIARIEELKERIKVLEGSLKEKGIT